MRNNNGRIHLKQSWEAYLNMPQAAMRPYNSETDNIFEGWIAQESNWLILSSFALSVRSLPAMEADCERTFSSTEIMITDHRCSLPSAAIEVAEVQRSYWVCGVVRAGPDKQVLMSEQVD